jgi:hypothetical protein
MKPHTLRGAELAFTIWSGKIEKLKNKNKKIER